MERLNKFLAACGLSSRRKADELIRSGRVTINRRVVTEPYLSIDPGRDCVSVDGQTVRAEGKTYIALYKPTGYISDLADPRGRPIARSLIPLTDARLFPVGRLDYNSEGLMIFTNDGAFAQRLAHPRFAVEKEYLVKFHGLLEARALERVRKGVILDGELCRPRTMELVAVARSNAWYRIVTTEGKNRMIRRIGDAVGHRVMRLRRLRLGPIQLGDMKPGEWRVLSQREVKGLVGTGVNAQMALS